MGNIVLKEDSSDRGEIVVYQPDEGNLSTVANFATVQKEGNRVIERIIEYYNLDMIISIGYRVKSDRG